MYYWEDVHTEELEGFTITLSITPEEEPPDWEFESEEQRLKLYEDIDNGNLLWFVAKVTASKCGLELYSDYLGGNCYINIKEFINPEDYYGDMVHTCILEAKRKIIELQY